VEELAKEGFGFRFFSWNPHVTPSAIHKTSSNKNFKDDFELMLEYIIQSSFGFAKIKSNLK